jgi:hypothetical protein
MIVAIFLRKRERSHESRGFESIGTCKWEIDCIEDGNPASWLVEVGAFYGSD